MVWYSRRSESPLKLTVEPLGLEVLETRQTVDHREYTLLGDILLHRPKCNQFLVISMIDQNICEELKGSH